MWHTCHTFSFKKSGSCLVNYTYDEEFCKAFGNKLREMRKTKKISMEKLALQADIEYSQIARIERGVTNPTISTVNALAKALNVPVMNLFDF